MYMDGMKIVEDLHAIDIVRAAMDYWFTKLEIAFDPLELFDETEFYDWEQVQADDEGAQVRGSFEQRGVRLCICLLLEWRGPNAAVIRTFKVHRNSDERQIGMHIVRREHAYASWRATPRRQAVDTQDALRKLLVA